MKTYSKEDLDNINISYSLLSKIESKGVEYAIAEKLGVIPQEDTDKYDFGKIVHSKLLEGKEIYAVSPFENFRTKVAQEWKKEQTLPILSEQEVEAIQTIVDKIVNSNVYNELTEGETEYEFTHYHEVGKKKKIFDIINHDKKIICDLKVTGQFDKFEYQAKRLNYDIQAWYYTSNPYEKYDFYFLIIEDKFPYRLKLVKPCETFIESGYEKAINSSRKFNKFKENFNGKFDFIENETIESAYELY